MTDVKHELKALWQDHPELLATPVDESAAAPPVADPSAETVPAPAGQIPDGQTPADEPTVAVADLRTEERPVTDWYAALRDDAIRRDPALAEEAEPGPAAPAAAWESGAAEPYSEPTAQMAPLPGAAAEEGEAYFAGFEAVSGPGSTWRRGDDDIVGRDEPSGRRHRPGAGLRLIRRA